MLRSLRPLALALPLGLMALSTTTDASAFCGFYVAGADAKLYNNATMVVLMREGTRTVLSMQNNYQGPPENFAMVVPVPVVLQEENVKTLPAAVFDKVDKLASPRLVEYWEQDPCAPEEMELQKSGAPGAGPPKRAMARASSADDLGVTIEAEFTVGEYQIVILSAKDSLGLDTWLRQEKYSLPAGSEPLLRPYVAGGSKFFVAKVDISKVRFENGMAALSPLRFHYDTDTFALPVRLGLVNSAGKQDLLVHILARGKRFETANFKNVAIPTNLDVKDEVRTRFGSFYAALFDRTLERHPGAAVTEYSWDAGTCDPCPGPTLTPADLGTLGADVIDNVAAVARRRPRPARWPRRRAHAPTSNAPPVARPERLRPHAPAPPLWQRDLGGRSGVPRGAPHRRRARVRARWKPAGDGRGAELDQQFPGALCHPSPVDGAHRLQEPEAGALGRPALRHAEPWHRGGAEDRLCAPRWPSAPGAGRARRRRDGHRHLAARPRAGHVRGRALCAASEHRRGTRPHAPWAAADAPFGRVRGLPGGRDRGPERGLDQRRVARDDRRSRDDRARPRPAPPILREFGSSPAANVAAWRGRHGAATTPRPTAALPALFPRSPARSALICPGPLASVAWPAPCDSPPPNADTRAPRPRGRQISTLPRRMSP
jgi:hypothetical protein